MCYRCSICDLKVPPRTPLLRHTVYRDKRSPMGVPIRGKEIAAELPVCGSCDIDLKSGTPLSQLRQHYLRNPRPQFKAKIDAKPGKVAVVQVRQQPARRSAEPVQGIVPAPLAEVFQLGKPAGRSGAVVLPEQPKPKQSARKPRSK